MSPMHDPHLKPNLGEELGRAFAEHEDRQIMGTDVRKEDTFAYHRATREQEEKDAVPVLKDSGERRQFGSGAVRDRAAGKGRFDLITPQMMFRLARHYEAGAIKYSDRNWEKGMEFNNYLDAAFRHLEKYEDGWMDEDHLAAAIWNIAALMHHELHYPELDNLPRRQRDDVDTFKWVVRRPEDA
jgi:hypothetical protein